MKEFSKVRLFKKAPSQFDFFRFCDILMSSSERWLTHSLWTGKPMKMNFSKPSKKGRDEFHMDIKNQEQFIAIPCCKLAETDWDIQIGIHPDPGIHSPDQVSNPVRYPEILNDLGLGAGYGLCSVMSHLGHATEGHFITHRVSWHDEVNYIDGNCNCNAVFASQPKCQVFGVLESRWIVRLI